MDLESSSSSGPLSSGISDSPSSIVAEATNSDSQEQLLENENSNTEEIVTAAGKKRRINRRVALAMERSKEAAPSPIFAKKVLTNQNNTIDLTVEDDDPTHQWFKKTFENHGGTSKKVQEEKNPFAVPKDVHKNVPKSLKMSQILKKRLEASLSVKRKQGQEMRRQQYLLDNAHLFNEDEEEEEEEEEIKKKKKKAIKKRRSQESDYDSEDDEDYKDEGSEKDDSGSEDSDDEEKPKEKEEAFEESPDLFENRELDNQNRADDEISVNLLDDSFTYDVYNNRRGPGSTVSTYESQSRNDDILGDGLLRLPSMSALISKSSDSQNVDDMDNILDLCSGRFGSAEQEFTQKPLPDTLQILENMMAEEGTEKKREASPTFQSSGDQNGEMESAEINDGFDEEEEDEIQIKMNKTINRTIASDDEEEEEAKENDVVKDYVECDLPETVPLSSPPLEEESNILEETEVKITRRIVLSDGEDDDDDNDEKEAEEDDIEEEEDEADEGNVEEEAEEVEKEEEEEEEEPAPTFDDEDDELAVMKRLQYQEYKIKSKKKNFFDDEASLSGDDVGSDAEDEEGDDEYEAEEGDADDVPDSNTIRRQNHQLLMRQELAKEQRAVMKLQDKLFADGDLGGADTNRQFRFKIRQEEEAKIMAFASQNDGDDQDIEEVDGDEEESEEKRIERAKMLKFRIEKAEELMLLDEPKGVDDPFERAARLVKTTKEQMNGVVEEVENANRKKMVVKPTLLRKTTLATSIQEVLAAGGAVPKQMYVQNFNSTTTTTISKTSSTSTGKSVKRGRQSPESTSSKRVRQSKLSVLE